jgi:DedD protein
MASQKATEISAVELEMKRRGRRRLIGAITLGLLAIVFLPMIFDSKPREARTGSQEISVQIPSKEGLPPLPAPVQAPPAAKAAPSVDTPKTSTVAPVATATPATPPPAVSTVTPLDAKPVAKIEPAPPKLEAPKKVEPPKVVAKLETKPEPKPAPKVETAAPKQGFVVQVGAFKDADNAQQIAAKAKELKLPVYTDTVATSSGSVTRVRVGPFATREKADSALVQVKLSGADGKIVPLP